MNDVVATDGEWRMSSLFINAQWNIPIVSTIINNYPESVLVLCSDPNKNGWPIASYDGLRVGWPGRPYVGAEALFIFSGLDHDYFRNFSGL